MSSKPRGLRIFLYLFVSLFIACVKGTRIWSDSIPLAFLKFWKILERLLKWVSLKKKKLFWVIFLSCPTVKLFTHVLLYVFCQKNGAFSCFFLQLQCQPSVALFLSPRQPKLLSSLYPLNSVNLHRFESSDLQSTVGSNFPLRFGQPCPMASYVQGRAQGSTSGCMSEIFASVKLRE